MIESIITEYDYITIEKLKKHKKVLLVWSGGFDSTLILCDLLHLIKRMTKEEAPDLCTISLENTVLSYNKIAQERSCRERIKYKLIEAGFKFDSVVLKSDLETFMTSATNAQYMIANYNDWCNGLAQPQLWISQLVPLMGDNTLVVFGYIKEDDVWQYKHAFMEMFKYACMLRHIESTAIAFPLKYKNKTNVLREMMDNYKDVYEVCWTCETPKDGKPCGECHPCEVKKNALARLLIENNFNAEDLDKFTSKVSIDMIHELDKVTKEKKNTIDKLQKEIEEKEKKLKEIDVVE